MHAMCVCVCARVRARVCVCFKHDFADCFLQYIMPTERLMTSLAEVQSYSAGGAEY